MPEHGATALSATLVATSLQLGGGGGHGGDDDKSLQAAAEESLSSGVSRLLDGRIWIPGTLHIVHHVVDELLGNMRQRKEFLEDLAAITNFFKHQRLREKFVVYCLTGSHGRHRVLFDDFPATYIEWRWRSLLACVRHLLSLQPLLVLCWDRGKMVGPADLDSRGKDDAASTDDRAQAVGAVVENRSFWAFCSMLALLSEGVDVFLAWAQSCSCRPSLHLRKACGIMVDADQSSASDQLRCPMMGCRAADMANGKWRDHLEFILKRREADVVALTAGLGAMERATLMQDWSSGRETLTLGLQLRLEFYDNLPHRQRNTQHATLFSSHALPRARAPRRPIPPTPPQGPLRFDSEPLLLLKRLLTERSDSSPEN